MMPWMHIGVVITRPFTLKCVESLPLVQPSTPDEIMEGGTAGFISVQCFQMLRNMADAVMKWNPIGSILIGSQLTVVSLNNYWRR